MGTIKVLAPDVAALIAAGEVVERPSSVIKELVENSIDADAKTVTVEIKNGGISYMRVSDDGAGMQPDDAKNAFLRHATSKIELGDDLERITTLGFRGEALYSIAAVSRVEMLTARRGCDEGTYIRLEAGEVLETAPAGCPQGTTVTVKDLFFNTPARMKFLKRDATEAGYIEDILRRNALSRPDISFRYINSGKEVFFTPGDGVLKNVVYAIYGAEAAKAMLPASYEHDGIHVSGLVGKAELSKGNRSFQTFFVNGRSVINKNLYFALTESYKSHMMTGRFPVAVLNISLNPALCDVNVHPSKAEIKFANEKAVHSAVHWAAKNALHKVEEIREMVITPEKAPAPSFAGTRAFVEKRAPQPLKIPEPVRKAPLQTVIEEPMVSEKTQPAPPVQLSEEKFAPQSEEVRVIGQLLDTYIVAQTGEAMLLCDQHAAHERVIYDRLIKRKGENASSQMLIVPESLELTGSEFGIFSENIGFFGQMGFEVEEFGHNTVRIRMIPEGLAFEDAAGAVLEILEILSSGREEITTLRDKALYSLACRAALKAGKRLSAAEQEQLVRRVLTMEGEATCPHGRPVILRLTRTQIEKQFKRIV